MAAAFPNFLTSPPCNTFYSEEWVGLARCDGQNCGSFLVFPTTAGKGSSSVVVYVGSALTHASMTRRDWAAAVEKQRWAQGLPLLRSSTSKLHSENSLFVGGHRHLAGWDPGIPAVWSHQPKMCGPCGSGLCTGGAAHVLASKSTHHIGRTHWQSVEGCAPAALTWSKIFCYTGEEEESIYLSLASSQFIAVPTTNSRYCDWPISLLPKFSICL